VAPSHERHGDVSRIGAGLTDTGVPLAEIPLKGEHNIENVLAAVCAACVAKIPAEVIARTVASFHAVEHRLEFVAAIHGVDYYNDSKATNVDATAKAIASFPGKYSPDPWRQG
jgi:UDP-N-acetylmuramoylalanine--D-glutamate ligase